MAKYKVTIEEIPDDNEGCAVLFVIIVLAALYFLGDSVSDNVDYWKGDKNCPIFTKRDDGSMVVFKKDSAREVDRYYSNGDKLIVFQGYEVEPDGYFRIYGYYGFFYNKSDKYYKVFYPETLNFPNGQKFTIKNDYQINVCKVMIKSASNYDKLKFNN